MLPNKYQLAVVNNSGAVINVKVISVPNTVGDDGAGQTEPVYGTETTVLSNAALGNGATEVSGVITNDDYLGLTGILDVTPAASASGSVRLYLQTSDAAGGTITDAVHSEHLRTIDWVSETSAKRGSFKVQ